MWALTRPPGDRRSNCRRALAGSEAAGALSGMDAVGSRGTTVCFIFIFIFLILFYCILIFFEQEGVSLNAWLSKMRVNVDFSYICLYIDV